ncbi:deleted in malignant brain tumors 1 protein-like [Octopus vulgaris]|uniref:Deleted in malignant brain tumors 1 protein-like n=1 Tax=Octopus vulgaris TaxID=6645 RepID=A0AA36F3G9_OCTVU|nr:deleted in malignant brain tumors 1 protein-like [Octopus vulgaris]
MAVKVRLTSGSQPHKGTVEVLFNGQWGGICYTNDANIGTVLARMMGYTKGTIYPVNPTLPLLKHSKCNGNEPSLGGCPSLVWSTTCAPNKIIGITLSKDIRLVSHTRSRGRVEILHNKIWGGICADQWTDQNAQVTCSSLGFLKGKVLRGEHHRSGKVHLSNIKCTTNDAYLLNCSHDAWGFHGCPSTERAAVECYRHDLRLKDGSNSKEGRVEIMKNGVWGTVCDSDWDNEDASVLCRDLGYAQGTAYNGWKFGPGQGPIFHQNVDCIGDEFSFEQCFLPEWSDNMRCDHGRDAGVACFNEKVRLNYGELENEGQVEVSLGSGWGSVCSDYWDNENAHVLCRMLGYETGLSYQDNHRQVPTLPVILNAVNCSGDERSIFDCPAFPSRQCIHTGAWVRCSRVKVTDEYLPDRRITVHHDGMIGTICPNVTWSDKDASVVCRMRGFMHGFALSKPDTTTYPVGLADLSCTGKEMSLDECSYTDESRSRCKISSNINVHCSNIEVRIDGNSKNATVGLVQVLYNGIWGTVCKKGWNDEGAQVVCRSMGYKTGQMVSKYVSHVPVRNTHQFWLDNIDCTGNETDLAECKHSNWGDAYCDQENCAAAWCSDYVGIRLKDGRSKQEGRVEILHNRIWGSVCDDSWDDNDATVVCRMLGYSYGKATVESKHGFTRGQIWLDDVGCDGREFSLESCSHLEWGWHNCNHDEDAGVICSNTPDAIIG